MGSGVVHAAAALTIAGIICLGSGIGLIFNAKTVKAAGYGMVSLTLGWIFIVITAFVMLGGMVLARDLDGRYAQKDPVMHQWFESLRNQDGGYCCADADGFSLADVDWESNGGHYRVRLPINPTMKLSGDSIWVDVPDSAVVQQKNLANRTMVWPQYESGGIHVNCFLPGSMS